MNYFLHIFDVGTKKASIIRGKKKKKVFFYNNIQGIGLGSRHLMTASASQRVVNNYIQVFVTFSLLTANYTGAQESHAGRQHLFFPLLK